MRRAFLGVLTACLACAPLAACGSGSAGPAAPSRAAGGTASPVTSGTAVPSPSPSGSSVTPTARATATSPTPARAGSSRATASGGRSAGGGAVPARWRPTAGLTWQWQIDGSVDTSVTADVFDVDLFTTSAATVKALQAKGTRVICYVNVGAAEDFRPDYRDFGAAMLGKGNGWPGERWLDIRRRDVVGPVMARRFDLCKEKGFDGVEPDLTEAASNDTGFPISDTDQIAYNRYIARLAHERGLAVGLKNYVEKAGVLVGDFDFAVNEQCFEFGECEALLPFVRAGKPVFHVEYEVPAAEFCPTVRRLGFSSMEKRYDLDAWRITC